MQRERRVHNICHAGITIISFSLDGLRSFLQNDTDKKYRGRLDGILKVNVADLRQES